MPAIAFEYPEEIRDVREGLGAFIRTEIIPRHERHAALLSDPARKYAADGRYSPEVWEIISEVRRAAAAAGYYALAVPEALGGAGMGYLAYFGAWHAVLQRCGPKYWLAQQIISHWAKGPSPVLAELTPTAQDALLPDIMSGRKTLCFALSEPGAGSDAAMIRSRAVAEGDGWRLNGGKIWITNSPHADYAVVFAVTEPELAAKRNGGISAFLVPTDSPGFRLESTIRMWGNPGTIEGQLAFEDVRIEPHQLIGTLHQGFAIAMLGVGLGRLFNSARAIGFAQWALDLAFDYVKVRQTFGRPISAYQAVTFPLVDCATRVHAAHLMALNAAQLLDRGLPASKELSMTKAFAAETGCDTLDRVMQVHGAMGFTNEMHLTDAYITMRKIMVADGSAEILRHLIAKRMLAGDMEL